LAIPLIALIYVMLSFASVFLQLQPMPYYLGIALPYILLINVLFIVYLIFFNRKIIFKTMLCSIVPFGLGYLWFIQTV
jgi:hypothetical protein